MRLLFWLLIASLPPATAQTHREVLKGKRFSIEIRFSEIANLVWHLETMSNSTNGDAAAYRRLWTTKLNWTAADDGALERWKSTLSRTRSAKLGAGSFQSSFPPNYPSYYGRGRARSDFIRAQMLEAADLDDFQRRLRPALGRSGVARCVRVLQHFLPRFQSWWKPLAVRTVPPAGRDLINVAKDYGVVDLGHSLALVAGAEFPPSHTILFDFMVHPETANVRAVGTQVRNHAVLEAGIDGPVARHASLFIHEMMHHFFDSAPEKRQMALVAEFAQAPESFSLGLYSYLNEALATAASILFESRVRKPEAFAKYLEDESLIYRNATVAKLGKIVYPLLDRCVRQHKTVFDGFAANYIASAQKALGSSVHSPQLELATRSVHFRNGALAPVAEHLNREIPPMTIMTGVEPLSRYRDLSAAVLLLDGDWRGAKRTRKALAPEQQRQLQRAVRENAQFVFAVRRSPKSHVYIFVAQNSQGIRQLIDAFARNGEPFEGLRFATPRR